MKLLQGQVLMQYCTDVLVAAGVDVAEAGVVAACLVDADLCGISTHGVSRLPIYVQRLHAGVIEKKNNIKILRESPSALAIDAGNTLGMPAAQFAMDKCIEKAAQTGCCFATVKNSNHFGAGGFYIRQAADRGMVGFISTNLTGKIAPFGAAEPYVGTNPIGVAVPGQDMPIVLDIAPSVVAMGKLIMAQKLGKPIPLGWALDKDGKPTTDPAEGRNGSLVPIGGHKGSGIAIMVDILCGILSGGKFGPHMHDLYSDMVHPQEVGHFMGAIDISKFIEQPDFKEGITQMSGEIKSLRKVDVIDEILMPGELEWKRAQKGLVDGIQLPDEVYAELNDLGAPYGLTL